MATEKSLTWLDILSKLGVPVIIFVLGTTFTIWKSHIDDESQQFERNTGYVKLLTSANPKERKFALAIILELQKRREFPSKLAPVLLAMCTDIASGGEFANLPPSDPDKATAQQACGLLQAQGEQQSGSGQADGKQEPVQTKVFIQIANNAHQEQTAERLKKALEVAKFDVPSIEAVGSPTWNTYVRYFDDNDEGKARRVLEVMKADGINGKIQRNRSGSSPNELEVWIGKKEGAQP